MHTSQYFAGKWKNNLYHTPFEARANKSHFKTYMYITMLFPSGITLKPDISEILNRIKHIMDVNEKRSIATEIIHTFLNNSLHI